MKNNLWWILMTTPIRSLKNLRRTVGVSWYMLTWAIGQRLRRDRDSIPGGASVNCLPGEMS